MEKIIFAEGNVANEDVTIAYSIKMTWHYMSLSAKKIWKLTDEVVHCYAWLTVWMVILVSFLIGGICVGSARAERDQANKKAYKLEQENESLRNQLEIEK